VKPVNAHRYYPQLIKLHRALREKRPHYRKRHDKLIFLHDNVPSHTSIMVQNYLETLNWEVLSHPAYSPDLASSDYHLFSSMGHALAEQHFDSYEDVRKWLYKWFASKDEKFFWRGIHKLLERWKKCIVRGTSILNKFVFLLSKKKNVFFWLKNSGFKLIPGIRQC